MTKLDLIKHSAENGASLIVQLILFSKCSACAYMDNGKCEGIEYAKYTKCENGIKEWLNSEVKKSDKS